MALPDKSIILGAGGFGICIQDPDNPGIAHKIFRSKVQPYQVECEFESHRRVHEITKTILANEHPDMEGKVCVPAPIRET